MLTFLEVIKGVDEQRTGIVPPDTEGAKSDKASVDYSASTSETERCALCEHYDNHDCTLVAGSIDPGYWCELFETENNWAERDCTRCEASKTGDPLVDFILQMPVTSRNINDPIIDRSQPTPYGAGGSMPLESPISFVDPSVPHKLRASGVAFDPADPWVVHENLEQRAMVLLISVGIDPELAYRFAHFCIAEVAESAWYRYHGIDPAEAEAVERPILDRLRTQQIGDENTNPALYIKPYPHDCEALARTEPGTDLAPTPSEANLCRGILMAVLGLADTARELPVDNQDLDKAVREYLSKHAPEIARLVKDQPGVGDVHAPSALGNERRRKERKGKPIKGKPIDVVYGENRVEPRKAISFGELVGRDVMYLDGGAELAVFKQFQLNITKIEDDKQQIFGWASVTTVNGQEVIDKQGDIIPTNEIEKSAYEFVQFSRDMGDMHLQLGTGRMIESVVFTTEKAACGITAKDADGNTIEGWWVGFSVIDPETWKSFKAGDRPELSIGGRASWEEA